MGFWDSVANLVEKQFVNRALNLSGQHKDIYCETCGQITDHISISHAASLTRSNKHEGRGVRALAHIVGKLSDLNPAENILIGRPYRCGKCGKETLD